MYNYSDNSIFCFYAVNLLFTCVKCDKWKSHNIKFFLRKQKFEINFGIYIVAKVKLNLL